MGAGNPDLAPERDGAPVAPDVAVLPARLLGVAPPAPVSSFVGRRRECVTVARLLAENRLLTLTGAGGIGKTRLVVELARNGMLNGLGGVAWADLGSVADAEGIDSALLAAVGLTRGPGATPIELLVTELSDRQGVLLIDNCEQVADAVGERAEQILQRCPGMRVLATSRAPLGVNGEATWIVPALSMDESAASADNDAALLFVTRARSTIGELVLSEADVQLVDAICRELEGVPLAIELAAAHLRTASLQEVHDRLADRLAVLISASALGVARQRAVRASIDWSHALLGEREQILFRRLAVFAGGWDVEAMRAVCTGPGLGADELPGLLDALVLNSIVHANRDGAATRYSMLEVVREYARERLSDAGEAVTLADRYVAHYVALARRADHECWVLDSGQRAILGREAANFAAALTRSCSTGDGAALELVGHLGTYWRETDALAQGAESASRALAACSPEPSPARAFALMWHGCFVFQSGDFTRAMERFSECEAMLERAPSARVSAWVGGLRATSISVTDPRLAAEPLEAAITVAQQAGDELLASYLLVPLLISHDCRDDGDGVQRTAARAGAIAVEIGHQLPQRWVAWSLARQALLAGDLERCRAQLDVGRRLSGRLDGEARCGVEALASLAEMYAGNLGGARECANMASELARAGTYWIGTGNVSVAIGFLALAEGDLAAARSRGEELSQRAAGGAHLPVHGYELLLMTAMRAQDSAGAQRAADALAVLATRYANQRAAALALYGDAVAASLANDRRRAQLAAIEAMELQLAGGWLPGALHSLELIAATEHVRGHPERSLPLFAAASAMRARLGLTRLATGLPGLAELEQHADAAAPVLDGADARSAAEVLDLDDALAFARNRRVRTPRAAHGVGSLTPAEWAVAELAAQGLSNPAIAERLLITRATVKTHLAHIYEKLDVANRTELATIARRVG